LVGGYENFDTTDPPVAGQQEGNFYFNVSTGLWRWFHNGAWADAAPAQIATTVGYAIKDDGSGDLGIYKGATNIATIEDNGNLVILTSAGVENSTPNTNAVIYGDASGVAIITAGNAVDALYLYDGSILLFKVNVAGKIRTYNSLPTQGIGVPAVYASSIQNLSNSAPAQITYTPPATIGTYRMSYWLDITTATSILFTVNLVYTDTNGTPRSFAPLMFPEGGATGVNGGPAGNTAGRWYGSQMFGIDNSGNAISIQDNSGSYINCAYRWHVTLEQLA